MSNFSIGKRDVRHYSLVHIFYKLIIDFVN
jgi:hypothetical protein